MIDDELLNNGQNSPPPPAPNGENQNEIFQSQLIQQRQMQDTSWNPFSTPTIQQKEQHSQFSSMNPFHADLMKQQVHGVVNFHIYAIFRATCAFSVECNAIRINYNLFEMGFQCNFQFSLNKFSLDAAAITNRHQATTRTTASNAKLSIVIGYEYNDGIFTKKDKKRLRSFVYEWFFKFRKITKFTMPQTTYT